MSTADFKSILSHKVGSIEKPKPLPMGTYAAVVEAWETVESGQKKTPGVKVSFKLLQPSEDVDMDQLEEVGGLPAVTKRKIATTYWLTEDSLYRLKEFIELVCKIDVGDRTLGECLPDCLQVQVKLGLKHRFTDKQEIVLDIDTVLAAD